MAAEGTMIPTMIHMAPLATDTGLARPMEDTSPARPMQGPCLRDLQNTELTVQTDITREAHVHLIEPALRH